MGFEFFNGMTYSVMILHSDFICFPNFDSSFRCFHKNIYSHALENAHVLVWSLLLLNGLVLIRLIYVS